MADFEQFPRFGLAHVTRRPLPALAPVLSSHGPVPAEIDTRLGALALRSQAGDRDARNALYAAFAPRLDPAVRRAQWDCLRLSLDPAIQSDDVAQQAFLVFVELLQSWQGGGSLSGYIITVFPWRLARSMRRLAHPRAPRIPGLHTTGTLADGSYRGDEAISLLTVLAATFPGREGDILLLRIRDGMNWEQIARHLGIDRRTALRDWRGILIRLRAELLPLL